MAGVGLALSGGGSRGAFIVGALRIVRQRLGPRFPVISGTSTGSLIGTLLAVDDFTPLVKFYSGAIQTSDIVNPRFALVSSVFGTSAGLFAAAIVGGRAIFDSQALADTIHENVDFAAVKDAYPETLLVYNTVDLQTGDTVEFNNRDHSAAVLEKALLASANMPVLTDPVAIKVGGTTHQYVDGGVREYLPLSAVFGSGVELDRIVAIAAAPSGAKPEDGDFDKITDILRRTIDCLDAEVSRGDYLEAQQINAMLRMVENAKREGVPAAKILAGLPEEIRRSLKDKRDVDVLLIAPEEHLTMDSLTFDADAMKAAMDLGIEAAKEALDAANL